MEHDMERDMERDTLLANLVAVADDGSVEFGEESYIDFSVASDEGGRVFEVRNGDDYAWLELSRSDMLRLHAALTRVLLESA